MKDVLKYIGLLTVGLFVAIVVYPFLHECGHSIMAILVGAKVVEFNLLPLPYVMCDVSEVTATGQAMIGLGGIIIPYILPGFIKTKKFWSWYAMFLVRGISLYAVIISLFAAILYFFEIRIANEDIVQVLELFPNRVWLCIIAFVLMIIYSITAIVKGKPILRCLNYFNIEENKKIPNN